MLIAFKKSFISDRSEAVKIRLQVYITQHVSQIV